MGMNLSSNNSQRSLGVLLLMFLTAAGYELNGVLQKFTTWEYLWNPPGVGDLVMVGVFGCGAVLIGLGVDVPALFKGLGFFQGPKSE